MPLPSFFGSPRPDQFPEGSPASQSSSRFGALHDNVRSMINGSSVYSQSPMPADNNTPKLPLLGFLRRPQSPPAQIPISDTFDPPRNSNDSRSPLRPQHTAGSYARTISPLQDPRQLGVVYSRHPADVPLPGGGLQDPEIEQLADEINGRRRRRRRHRRRKHRRQDRWVRHRNERGTTARFVKGTAARGKLLACILSGLFLITVLAIYLALALTNGALGQEVHVLFIMIVLGTTIFFCHSLIRLCMLILHPPSETEPRIPSMTGPEGFQPVRPIRVHVARDEELGDTLDDDDDVNENGEPISEKKIVQPPPAYGLWRSSVRVDPNLLHWQRVDDTSGTQSPLHNHSGSRNGSVSGPSGAATESRTEPEGPRPPSYISEDGVSYITEAAPRSTVAPGHTGVSDIHPAWRPGYAVSEVSEWPAPTGPRRA